MAEFEIRFEIQKKTKFWNYHCKRYRERDIEIFGRRLWVLRKYGGVRRFGWNWGATHSRLA